MQNMGTQTSRRQYQLHECPNPSDYHTPGKFAFHSRAMYSETRFMSFQLLSLEEVASYLHLTPAEIEQRVKDREIPFEKRGRRIVFSKSEIDQWASRRILNLQDRQLDDYHQKSTTHTRKMLAQETILPDMLGAGAIASAMTAKTKASVLRDLVALTEKTGHLSDAKALLASVEEREELCPTAMPGGFAMPHPRFHESHLFDSSLIVVGRTIQEIHFGSPDGEPTTLFFLICCQDDRLHLHTLARLCLIAQKTVILDQLREAPDAKTMRDDLITAELAILEAQKTTS
jgi:nitrogen PTS system EIIA component